MALDKVVDSAVLDAGMKSVADAIRAKAGTTDLLAWPDGFKAAVEGIQTGGGGGSTSDVAMKDVNFYDYDGTLVASYTLAEAQALTSLPDGPTHDGLTFQGWNLSLEKIHALTRPMNVGAMYITDDGATRLHIRIATIGRMTVPLYIFQTVANGVTIDWGDGSAEETLVGTGNVNTTHTYAEPGDYIISLIPQDGCTLSFGAGSSSYCVMGSTRNNGKVYCNMLKEVYIGDGVTSIGDYAFGYCYSLESITIPNGVTSIDTSSFYNCYAIAKITFPNGVTSISISAFYNCYGMRYYDFSACTSVPALSNTNAFNNLPSDCQMLIPAALYDEWSTATNWSTYADHIVGV